MSKSIQSPLNMWGFSSRIAPTILSELCIWHDLVIYSISIPVVRICLSFQAFRSSTNVDLLRLCDCRHFRSDIYPFADVHCHSVRCNYSRQPRRSPDPLHLPCVPACVLRLQSLPACMFNAHAMLKIFSYFSSYAPETYVCGRVYPCGLSYPCPRAYEVVLPMWASHVLRAYVIAHDLST